MYTAYIYLNIHIAHTYHHMIRIIVARRAAEAMLDALAKGAEVNNTTGGRHETPLMLAAAARSAGMALWLVEGWLPWAPKGP